MGRVEYSLGWALSQRSGRKTAEVAEKGFTTGVTEVTEAHRGMAEESEDREMFGPSGVA
jgi:hypothetical protein